MKVTMNKEFEHDIQLDNWDTWNIDSTLAPIILALLSQYKGHMNGAPWVNQEDVPKELRASEEETAKYDLGEVDDNHFIRWEWIVDEMIFAFSQLVDEDYFFENDIDIRINNGLRLFGVYFRGLWD